MTWNSEQLNTFASQDEMRISSKRKDGSYSKPVIVWFVQVGERLVLRSVHGADTPWYRAAVNRGRGRVEIGGDVYEVAFTDHLEVNEPDITSAYKQKYSRYPGIVESTYTPMAVAAPLQFELVGDAQ